MRVLFLSDLFPPYLTGGAERIVARDMMALRGLKDLTLGVLTTHPFFGPLSLLPKKDTILGIARYSYYPYSPIFQKDYFKAPIPYRFLELCLGMYNPHSNLIARKIMADFKPDVVHSNYIMSISYSALRGINKPIVHTFHDYMFGCPKGSFFKGDSSTCRNPRILCKIQNHYIKSIFNHAEKIIVLSNLSKQLLLDRGYEPEKIIHLPNGIKIPKNAPDFSKKENIIVFLGQLTLQKGVETFIKAANELDLKGWKGLVIGQGVQYDALKSLISNKSIEMLGYLTEIQLREILAKAKILIVPSIWHDVFPTVILEAMVNGMAILGSKVGGIRELITDGVNGYTFEPGNQDELRRILAGCIDNESMIESLGRNSWNIVKTRYNIDDRLKRLVKIYADLV